jgi:carbon-monoxide dehydrogenase medium subunit
MIPAAFDYHAPATVEEALRLLGSSEDVKVLAGGQSLIPVLRLRLAAPEVIVDLGRIDSLRGIREDATTS